MSEPHNYARVERERRFLLGQFPTGVNVAGTRRIHDRYIADTTLRLRELQEDGRAPVFKLTQKLSAPASGAQQGLITTMYLAESEFRLLAQLPANEIRKTRYSVPPSASMCSTTRWKACSWPKRNLTRRSKRTRWRFLLLFCEKYPPTGDSPEANWPAPRDATFSSCCWKTASARFHCDSTKRISRQSGLK